MTDKQEIIIFWLALALLGAVAWALEIEVAVTPTINSETSYSMDLVRNEPFYMGSIRYKNGNVYIDPYGGGYVVLVPTEAYQVKYFLNEVLP